MKLNWHFLFNTAYLNFRCRIQPGACAEGAGFVKR